MIFFPTNGSVEPHAVSFKRTLVFALVHRDLPTYKFSQIHLWSHLESIKGKWPSKLDVRSILLAMNPHSFPSTQSFQTKRLLYILCIFPQINILWVRKNHHGPNPLSPTCRQKGLSEMSPVFFPERPEIDLLLLFMSRILHCTHTNSTRAQRSS